MRLVSMCYSRCEHVYPILFEASRSMESNLPTDTGQQPRVGFVTPNPARDDVIALKQTADRRFSRRC